jgi:hypothetical protein
MNLKSAVTAALSGGLALMGASALSGSAEAALHGFCSTTAPCSDNGTNTPTSMDPPMFGFSAGATSDTGLLVILMLVPDNDNPTPYTLSGPLLGSKTQQIVQFKAPFAWDNPSESFDKWLGMPLGTSPDNALSDFLPATQALDPGATGYFVYDEHVGDFTLPSDADTSNSDLLTLNKALPEGSYVYGLLANTSTGDIMTVSSGAIFVDPASRDPAAPEPSTWAMMLLGFAGLAFAGYRSTQGRAGFGLRA